MCARVVCNWVFYFFMNSVMLTQPCEAGSFITFTEKATERLSNLPKVTQV